MKNHLLVTTTREGVTTIDVRRPTTARSVTAIETIAAVLPTSPHARIGSGRTPAHRTTTQTMNWDSESWPVKAKVAGCFMLPNVRSRMMGCPPALYAASSYADSQADDSSLEHASASLRDPDKAM